MNYLRKASHFLLATIFTLPFFTTSSAQAQQVSDLDLIKLREQIRSWANQYVCEDMTPIKEGTAAPEGCNKPPDYTATGDSVLFSSILCYSGEVWACRNIVESKDEQGGMWRSPQKRRTRSDGDWGLKRFSQDAMLGVLLYLVTEKNYGNPDAARNFANHWGSWMANHKSQGEFSLCAWNWVNPEAMDACALEGRIFGSRGAMVRRVFDHVGADSPQRRKGVLRRWYRLGDGGNAGDYFGYLNSVCMTALNRGGKFNCHLASIASLILQEMGDSPRALTDEGFRQNPFVLWVNNGRQPNEEIRRLTYERCSEVNDSHKNKTSKHIQWTWERSQFEQAWKDSAGWDCVAMSNLITNGRQEASRRRRETSPPSPVTFPPVARPGPETFPNTSSIRFCNGNSKQQTLYIAYARPAGDSGWQAYGWLPIPYAQCNNADLGIEYTGEVYIYAEDETGKSFIGRQYGQQKMFCVQSNKQQQFNISRSDERAFDCAASINGEFKGVWMNPYAVNPGLNTFTFLDKDNRSR